MLPNAKSLIRRLLHACQGQGPWRLRPFSAFEKEAQDDWEKGVHRPESFTGVLRCESLGPTKYRLPKALLGQQLEGEKIEGEPRYLGAGIAVGAKVRLYSLSPGAVVGSEGLVYCPRTRAAVLETVRCWERPAVQSPELGALGLPAPKRLPGITLTIASLSSSGFYHFLLESLPRLGLVAPLLDKVDHLLLSGPPDTLRMAWVQEAGLPREKIVWLDGLAHFRCDQLLFTDLPNRDCQPNVWTREALGQLFGIKDEPTKATRLLWISRRDASARHLRWEDQLLEQLPGYEKIVLSEHPPREQISLVRNARGIAGPHGAGFSLLAFARAGGRFVELFPKGIYYPNYSRLAGVSGWEAAAACVDFEQPEKVSVLAAAIDQFIKA